MSSLAVGDRVRLLHARGDVPTGAKGIVVGFFAREVRTMLVRFDAELIEVEPELLEAVREPPRPSSHDRTSRTGGK